VRRSSLTAAAIAAALAAATTAAAAPPRAGVLVPGKSLGGLRLHATQADVRAAWGADFGRCRTCGESTWYFTYRRFKPQGAGVAFRRGRVEAIFTLWKPAGWRTKQGLAIGDDASRIRQLYGPVSRSDCGSYYALLLALPTGVTAFYVWDGKVWGFGLLDFLVNPCR
jgi:hypothetical protein